MLLAYRLSYQGHVEMWPAKPDELPAKYRSGTLMDTVVANTDTAMAYLVRKFQSQGGRLTQRTVKDIQEAFAWYSIVVNCTGLGARELFNDKTVYAARGQVGTSLCGCGGPGRGSWADAAATKT